MSRRVQPTASPTTFGGSAAGWHKPDLLATRLASLVAGAHEMRAIVGELGACPYRSGLLGAAAPVLPSPDELIYVAKILARVSACVEHALENLQVDNASALYA